MRGQYNISHNLKDSQCAHYAHSSAQACVLTLGNACLLVHIHLHGKSPSSVANDLVKFQINKLNESKPEICRLCGEASQMRTVCLLVAVSDTRLAEPVAIMNVSLSGE